MSSTQVYDQKSAATKECNKLIVKLVAAATEVVINNIVTMEELHVDSVIYAICNNQFKMMLPGGPKCTTAFARAFDILTTEEEISDLKGFHHLSSHVQIYAPMDEHSNIDPLWRARRDRAETTRAKLITIIKDVVENDPELESFKWSDNNIIKLPGDSYNRPDHLKLSDRPRRQHKVTKSSEPIVFCRNYRFPSQVSQWFQRASEDEKRIYIEQGKNSSPAILKEKLTKKIVRKADLKKKLEVEKILYARNFSMQAKIQTPITSHVRIVPRQAQVPVMPFVTNPILTTTPLTRN